MTFKVICFFSCKPRDRYSEGPAPGDIWIEPDLLEQGDAEKVKNAKAKLQKIKYKSIKTIFFSL